MGGGHTQPRSMPRDEERGEPESDGKEMVCVPKVDIGRLGWPKRVAAQVPSRSHCHAIGEGGSTRGSTWSKGGHKVNRAMYHVSGLAS